QNGATMMEGNQVAFSNQSAGKNLPGLEALQFYTDFALATKNVYSWNKDMPYSLDAFLTGRLAFFFGYNYHLPTIKARAPRLNFAIAPIPQVNVSAPINYASYWLESVSAKSKHSAEAWDFIIFATTNERVKSYLDKTQKPAALKSLINSQLEDEYLYAASTQTLTAVNWYVGQDPLAAETALKEMLDQLSEAIDEKEFKNIINNGISKINQTLQ
ncbi:MAG TPA: extracellular solute-binding protein, partial [bacterium]|nr:extracellular solute-binding protein [bacterium]